MIEIVRDIVEILKPTKDALLVFNALEKQYTKFKARNYFLQIIQANSAYPQIELLQYDETSIIDFVMTKHSVSSTIGLMSQVVRVELELNDYTIQFQEENITSSVVLRILFSNNNFFNYKTDISNYERLSAIQSDIILLLKR